MALGLRRVDTKGAAQYTGLAESTLNKRRVFGGGPRYIQIGRRVLYDIADLDAWMEQNKRSSTSDAGRAA
ncbi:hypothetical protein EZH22_14085 [Xanthobacter dioxanivorans]|uniref:DNA-binding protein n=1 Tax=Xanthobacter dioxanivorans TaxID=2528964 RepID=A0A974SKA5_9HYPH|nr:transcriptional regulator [Xanthobacter dioxanivorans]QRG09281.1 hypothetical protein EZH22_14085 [Xanthobacter dioxanivorans]